MQSAFSNLQYVVASSNATIGRAVAGIAVDTPADDAPMMALVNETFKSWTEKLARQLAQAGIAKRRTLLLRVARE